MNFVRYIQWSAGGGVSSGVIIVEHFLCSILHGHSFFARMIGEGKAKDNISTEFPALASPEMLFSG